MDNVHYFLRRTVATIDGWLARSIAVDNDYRHTLRTIYCDWQSLSIDASHNLMWLAMAIDGHASRSIEAGNGIDGRASQYIVAGNGHRWTRFTICCGWQWPSMSMVRNLLRLAMAIDEHASQSMVVGNSHR